MQENSDFHFLSFRSILPFQVAVSNWQDITLETEDFISNTSTLSRCGQFKEQ